MKGYLRVHNIYIINGMEMDEYEKEGKLLCPLIFLDVEN
jgi:hypothetical protein